MRTPLILAVLCTLALSAAVYVPGYGDFALIAAPSLLAALWLVWRARPAPTVPAPRPAPIPGLVLPMVVVDGSNVLHWKDGTPQIDTLRDVVTRLRSEGFAPGVMFDANAGYLVAGKYQHDHAMARKLGLREDEVLVVDKGRPADETILTAARELGARVVSNDRFRDWADRFPEVHTPGHVIRGGYREGKLWLDTKGPGA